MGPGRGRFALDRRHADRRRHQGTGIGRAAVRTLASWLSTRENGTAVRLSCAPANETAAHLYTSLGFRPTGVEEDGEVVAELG